MVRVCTLRASFLRRLPVVGSRPRALLSVTSTEEAVTPTDESKLLLVMTLIVVAMGVFTAVQLWAAFPDHGLPGQLFLSFIFLFFALVGNFMGKVQRNFWMGVRTPWTLASETVWIRTHRLTAWLWVAAGLVGFVAVLLRVPFLVCFIGLIAVALFPAIYSLVIYKKLERQGKV